MLKYVSVAIASLAITASVHAGPEDWPPQGIPGAYVGEVFGGELRMIADLYPYYKQSQIGNIVVIRDTGKKAMIWEGPTNIPAEIDCVWPKALSYRETPVGKAGIQVGQRKVLQCKARLGYSGPFTDFTMNFVAD